MSPLIFSNSFTFDVMNNQTEIVRLGKRIKKLREATGKSQQVFADEADFDKKTLLRIEMGQTNPTIDTLISISKVLGIKVKDLLDY